MRVFVLCTGRCGSKSLYLACQFITNYTSGHETRNGHAIEDRLDYPENHIEIDNRLIWYAGHLWERYGDSAYYVHLTRRREDVINSFSRKVDSKVGIMEGWHWVSRMLDRNATPADYVDVVNKNIERFLHRASNKITISVDDGIKGFDLFCSKIGAALKNKKSIRVFDRNEPCRLQDSKTLLHA